MNPNTRVLVLTTSYPSAEDDPSGVFIAKLLVALARLGYPSKVVAPSDGTVHGRRIIHGIETIRFGYFFPRRLERLTVRGGGIPENMAQSRLARFQVLPMMLAFLVTALRESRGCRIFYANWLGAGIIGAILNILTGKPLVVSFRGDDGYLARDRPLWRALTRWVARRSSLIVPVSASIARIMLEISVPEEKCRLIQFGVDREMFRPPDRPTASGEEVRVLYVGALVAKKGVQDLLEAVAAPDLQNIRLVIVGEGILGPDLARRSDELGIGSRIDLVGPVPPAQVAEIMRSSDILCLPSYTEGRPNVVNEGMASGLPVIATRVGGIPDMVEEGTTALLFEPGDVEGLRGCLRTWAGDPEARRAAGRAGRTFLEKAGVSWDATARELGEIIRSILGG